MITAKGVIYESSTLTDNRKKDSYKKQISPLSRKASAAKAGGLNGDSGVGQALEFPSRSSAVKSSRSSVSSKITNTFAFDANHMYSHKSKEYKKTNFRIGSLVGTMLILAAFFGALWSFGPLWRVELGYQLSKFNNANAKEINTNTEPKNGFSNILSQALLAEPETIPDPNFSIHIPKIHAKAKIVPNVDPANYTAYMEALKSGVAHAAGTQFPGNNGNIYLFAHSTDNPLNVATYNAVFYLLRELESGDAVDIYFTGIKHHYTVTNKLIIDPTDVSYLAPENMEGKERVILQTCWPPGTTLKRMLIFAEKDATLSAVVKI